jgi:multiple antibiotic resistance protein
MIEWGELFKFGVALLAIVEPFGAIPLFIGAMGAMSAPDRARGARIVALTVFLVLAGALFLGEVLLAWFGISIAAFMVGGGILLLLHAVSMLQARTSSLRQTPEETMEASERHAIGVVPIGIPLLAGPGAISSVIIYAHQASGGVFGVLMLLIPITAVCAVVWVTFRLAEPIARRIGHTGLNILTRLMGLLLAAMAVEIVARGLIRLFPALA